MSTTWRELCRELIDSRGADYYRTLERARKALADGPAVPEDREPASVTQQSTNMPDWRGLCEELLEALDGWHQAVFETGTGWVRPDETYLLDRARTALAQPEPEVAVPTDAQLIEEAIAVGIAFQPQDEVEEVFLPFDAEEPLDEELIAFARAVLARWCRHFPDATKMVSPTAEGEVAELVEELRDEGDARSSEPNTAFHRAAELLEQRHPAPVPVSERLPGPEDCDAEGRCWLFSKVEKEWRLIDAGNPGVPHLKYCFSHWLPATALPLPSGEVQP